MCVLSRSIPDSIQHVHPSIPTHLQLGQKPHPQPNPSKSAEVSPTPPTTLVHPTQKTTPRTSTLPPQPYIYTVPHSTLKIKFQEFGHRIPPSNVLLCLLKAANDVNLHFASPHASVGPSPLKTSSATVRLNLYPNGRHGITWAKWGAAIRGITDFMTGYEFVDLDYYILDDDFGGAVVGGGLVSNR